MIQKEATLKPNRDTQFSAVFFAFLFTFTFLVYLKAMSIPLISDDYVFVIDLSNWGIFGRTFFRPLIKLYADLMRPIFGMNPAGYHVFNILIHTANAFLVFLICKLILNLNSPSGHDPDRFKKNLTAAGLSLFLAANYSLSQAIFWLSGVTTLMQTLFILSVIYTYSLFVVKGKKSYLLTSLIFFLFGLGAKEGVFVMVGVIPLLYFSLSLKKPGKDIILSWAYFWSIGLLYILVAYRVLAVTRKGTYTFQLGWSLFRNIQQFILSSLLGTPFNDNSLHGLQEKILGVENKQPVSSLDPWLLAGILCYALLILILIKGGKRTWAFFLATLGALLPSTLPASHLSGWFYYPHPFRTYYTPAIFMVLLIALFFYSISLFKSRKGTTVMLLILLVAAGFNGFRIFRKADAWIEVGKQYRTVIEDIWQKLDPASVTTPRVLIKIVDGFQRRKVGRIFYKGVEVDYNISLIRIFNKKLKARFSIWAQRYRTKEKAYRSISKHISNLVKAKTLTLFIYADGEVVRVNSME
ncbi:hypothetical protein ACFLRB_05095 [Acidobacteriota bacterium]